MPIVTALLSYVSRQLGTVLRALFGWSVTGLFGQLPRAKEVALSGVLVAAILWPLLVVGVFAPAVASWALAFVPLQSLFGKTTMRIVWLALALLAPILVGSVVRWVSSEHRNGKGTVLRTIAYGYPLTLGFTLAFVFTVFVVPALKIAAVARGWVDEHVFLQVREGTYDETLRALERACQAAGAKVRQTRIPMLMRAPTEIVKWFARGGLDPIVASDPRMLRGDGLQLHLYPADLLLRGEKPIIAAVRAAMLRQPLSLDAHLVSDPKGQCFEDELKRMWEVVERRRDDEPIGGLARRRVGEMTRELEAMHLPFDQWVLLYTSLRHLEDAVGGGREAVVSKR